MKKTAALKTIALALSPTAQAEQYSIQIGGRDLARGRLLSPAKSSAASSATRARTVTREECVDCGMQIGACSCNGAAVAMSMAPDSTVPTGQGFGEYGQGGGGDYTGNPLNPPPCNPGCFPRSSCDIRSGLFVYKTYAEQLRASRMRKVPWSDPYYDSIYMDTLLSAITTVAAGASVNIPVFPTAGTFAMFYYEIVAVDPTTGVAQVDWTAGQPRIDNCPVPCGTGDTEALSQFVQKVPEACCGQPLAAWLDEERANTPLLVPFTNTQAAGDLSVQIRLRGYCCNNRMC